MVKIKIEILKTTIHILSVHANAPNPFISILANGISSDQYHVDSNINAFWDRQKKYDLIQIHWPEFLFYSKNKNLPTSEYGERLSETLKQWKNCGTKIVFTRHDVATHYVQGQEVRTNLFEIIESNADAIVHLGYFSKDQMIRRTPVNNQLHVVIPHHIYDEYYPYSFSMTKARKDLEIHEKFKVILTFGTFRDLEEHMLIKNAFEQLNEPDKYLFAPAWYHDGWHEYKNIQITLDGNCWLGRGTVNSNMLPYCFAAADVVFIQRLRNLNSGNLPMGFLFNKTVVAPAIGNMTEYLDNIHNFSFDPFDSSSVLHALEKGLERSKYPQMNKTYAMKHWSTAKICDQYRKLYQQLT